MTIHRLATGRLVAILLLLAMLAGAASPTTAAAAQGRERATVQGMYNDLMCVLCHESLAVAQSAESYQERALVRGFVAQDLTVKQIEDRMVAQYGPAVLAEPPKHGFSLLIYTLPKWRERSRQAAATPIAGAAPLPPEDAQRLDDELTNFI